MFDFITCGTIKRKIPRKKLKSDVVNAKNSKFFIETSAENKNVKMEGNLLNFEGDDIDVIYENEKPWILGTDPAKILGHKDANQAIKLHISPEERRRYDSFGDDIIKSHASGRKIQKNSIYISKAGVFNLILESKVKNAKKFKKYISENILDRIDDGEDVYEDDKVKEFTIAPSADHVDWALTHNCSEYQNENIVYLAVIGTFTNINDPCSNIQDGETIYKFGRTMDEWRRNKEHSNSIESFVCFHVAKCIRNAQLEAALKYEIRRKLLLRNIRVNGKNKTELFTTSEHFTIVDVISFMEKWIEKNDYKVNTDGNNELEIQKEKTKQMKIEAEVRMEEIKLRRDEIKLKQLIYERKVTRSNKKTKC